VCADITKAKMDEVELIQSLIDDLNELPYEDEVPMDALQRRVEMVIRNVFGESSPHMKDLKNIGLSWSVPRGAREVRKNKTLNLLRTILFELELFGEPQNSDKIKKSEFKQSNRIFVVHGHDGEMKESVARALEKLGLEPIILHEMPNKGLTIIEKFEDFSDVNFAVVLLSPDDMGYSKSDFPDGAKPRARQNVIFELGFFIGKLGRNRVAALYRGEDIEIPSDYDGVVYIPYDTSDGWKLKLVRELKECGYDIDMNKL
jgi:predicted nucleotide-binding protein